MADLEKLIAGIRAAAAKGGMSIDTEVYERASRDPLDPVLFAGSLDSRLAFLARDLGRDEVLLGEPLIGGAGRRVRRALYRRIHGKEPSASNVRMEDAVSRVLLTNTVPYKPAGNKAYPTSVRERFRDYVARLLVCHWQGDQVITLGTEAFLWFVPFAEAGAAEAFWKRQDRYESQFACAVSAICDGREVRKPVTVMPLPHPSPLNQTYLALFPGMLESRLESVSLD